MPKYSVVIKETEEYMFDEVEAASEDAATAWARSKLDEPNGREMYSTGSGDSEAEVEELEADDEDR